MPRAVPNDYFENDETTAKVDSETTAELEKAYTLGRQRITWNSKLKEAWKHYRGEVEHGFMSEYAHMDAEEILDDFVLSLEDE